MLEKEETEKLHKLTCSASKAQLKLLFWAKQLVKQGYGQSITEVTRAEVLLNLYKYPSPNRIGRS